MLKEALKIVKELADMRKVPQLLFMDGITYYSTIEIRDAIINFKKEYPSHEEIDLILETPGGSADDAYKIIRALRKNFTTVNIVVAFWAKSAGTLLSLGGNAIIMDEYAEFGPLDVQLRKQKEDSADYERESALNDEYSLKRIETRSAELFQNMFRVIYENENIPIHKTELSKQIFDYLSDFYKPLLKQINPYKLGDKKRKLEIGERYADKILTTYHPKLSKEKKDYLVDYFINGCPDHAYVIDYDTISKLLDGVKKSSTFGIDYERKLSELSQLFMKEITDKFIGFVPYIEEKIEENNTISVQVPAESDLSTVVVSEADGLINNNN